MKRAIARKWVKALKSGDYGQTTGQLREGPNFCCLGVLCNIHAQEHPEIASLQNDRSKYLGEYGVLPAEVMSWADMADDNGSLPMNATGQFSLIALNDNADYDFPAIAKVINKHWKEL